MCSGQSTCTKTLRCSKLDSAQADIEKGRICEHQRSIDEKSITDQQMIIRKHEQTIEDLTADKVNLNLKITDLEDKVKKRGRQRFTWSSVALTVGRLLAVFKL